MSRPTNNTFAARPARACCPMVVGALFTITSCSTASGPQSSAANAGQPNASSGASSAGSAGGPAGGSNGGASAGSSSNPSAGSSGASPAGGFGGSAGGSGGNNVSGSSSAGSGGGSGGATLHSWPQAGGPDGTFRANVPGAPTTWSVAAHQHILWQTNLDNEGQGGIAVASNLLFLTTFLPFTGSKNSLSIEGYAIDRATGAIKWRTKPLTGNGEGSGMAYQYSDATSWTPITDGKYVWFFNSAGHMGCW
ncbi:MAG TPA: hypothetical protein VIK01_00360, partial [Polyangiaceae bacterium]